MLEGSLEAVECTGNEPESSCEGADLCVAKYVWKRINDSITQAVDTIMLSQLIEESRKNKKKEYKICFSRAGGQKMEKIIYLDNAATTRTAPEVVEAMLPYFSELYGNPSSVYDFAGKSKEAITKSREQIAAVLGAKKEEIYFTAGERSLTTGP